MGRNLLVSVHLTHDRYHGSGDWPPAPARLFQALVAGAARGRALADASERALRWLEGLGAPLLAVPRQHEGQAVLLYVPNNDLDAVGGDVDRVPELRVGKLVQPRLLAPGVPLLYVWSLAADDQAAARSADLSGVIEGLYQLGRGVDMAWARAEVLEDEALADRLAAYPGEVHRPTPGGAGGRTLSCPQPGSLMSLRVRFAALERRFSWQGAGRRASLLFTQPPKARFVEVSYDSPWTHHLFELRDPSDPSAFKLWPLHRAHDLVVAVRDRIAARLGAAFEDRKEQIDQVLLGRAGSDPAPKRVRIVPLPSIGHEHVDRAIRRVLVQVPTGGAFVAEDVRWAASGEELEGRVLVPGGDEDKMLDRYGLGGRGYRSWQSVTPVVLPEVARRRRIEPTRKAAEAKGAPERGKEEAKARLAVQQALRHAGVRERVLAVRVQREPFDRRGQRAEAFAAGTRFEKERLWHVAIDLGRGIDGPLLIGDGRYLGLGVMAPGPDASAEST